MPGRAQRGGGAPDAAAARPRSIATAKRVRAIVTVMEMRVPACWAMRAAREWAGRRFARPQIGQHRHLVSGAPFRCLPQPVEMAAAEHPKNQGQPDHPSPRAAPPSPGLRLRRATSVSQRQTGRPPHPGWRAATAAPSVKGAGASRRWCAIPGSPDRRTRAAPWHCCGLRRWHRKGGSQALSTCTTRGPMCPANNGSRLYIQAHAPANQPGPCPGRTRASPVDGRSDE
jgi:hypothetical protein